MKYQKHYCCSKENMEGELVGENARREKYMMQGESAYGKADNGVRGEGDDGEKQLERRDRNRERKGFKCSKKRNIYIYIPCMYKVR